MDELKYLTFKQFVLNCRALKEQYSCLLMPFFDAEAIRCWKKMIYSIEMSEWQKDKIWMYLNDDLLYEELIEMI